MIGQTLAQYEISAKLGAGGMGEVYRARDTRLGRSVAVKVLPREFASDPGRLRRFEQEARILASLNHPNLLVIHDTGIHESAPYLVSELLEGQTLREQLGAGRLAVRKAVDYSFQIAQGLAAAHAKDIIHRDLKPENLFITKEGRVKILDFGLAKLTDHPPAGAGAEAPTVIHKTQPGVVLGTVGYMSPEQVRGGETDHRSDLFSFGVVLYEMLSGQQPFRRESSIHTMHAILTDDPPNLAEAMPNASPALIRLVAKCLAKDPDERWQTAKDLADELKWIGGTESQSSAQKPVALPPLRGHRITRIAFTALLVALAASLTLHFVGRRAPIENDVRRFAVPIHLPDHLHLAGIAMSPDGRYIAFTTQDSIAGKEKLWLRPMDSLDHVPLQDEGALPFWSPDSRFIGFFADGKLKKINLAGGPPQNVCDAPDWRGGTWSRNGMIVFAPSGSSGLYQVPAEGGQPQPVTTLVTNEVEQSLQEVGHRFPHFLPDGRHFLYYSRFKDPARSGIYLGSLEGGPPRRLLTSGYQAIYAPPGYLLFWVQGSLMAQPFAAQSLRLSGEARPIAQEVEVWGPGGDIKASVSDNGLLAYFRDLGGYERQLMWVDRTGKELSKLPVTVTDGYESFSLSPDGKHIALDRSTTLDLWLLDEHKSAPARFTFGQGRDWNPLWSSDGARIIFSSNRGGQHHLYQKLASGVADEELIFKDDDPVWRLKVPNDVSPDGRFLLYFQSEPDAKPWRLWVLQLDGKSKPTPLRQTSIGEGCGVFSPDGRWVAFESPESGSSQVYVQAFPAADRKWQVSDTVGFKPRWSPTGAELFYLAVDQQGKKLMAVEVKTGSQFELSAPKPLFDIQIEHQSMRAQYSVGKNGQRFLVYKVLQQTNTAPSAPMTIVLNWTETLNR